MGAVVRTQGALALDWLEEPADCDKVPRDMPSSRPNRRRRVERRQARAARRARRVALLVLLAAVFLVALGLTAFSNGPVRTAAIIPRPSLATTAQTRPRPLIVAQRGTLNLQLPISQTRLTAIGYHTAHDGALSLKPVGRQANEGLVSRVVHSIFGGGGGSPKWYQLTGGGTSAIDVGAPMGSDVYSPVDGTVVAIRPFVVEGKAYGSEIDIQPQTAPSLVVAVTQLVADPALNVGTSVVSGATKLGRVADLAAIEHQALARYTNDAGNHVTVEVRTAPVLTTG
jgi:murein DD-endopeptidase MepM/ murein hydrolase activator NlpD